MSHVHHITTNKQHLELRARIIRLIREFFWQENFLEVETPLILRLPGQEPYLSPIPVTVHNESKRAYHGYLHTSPEYTLKKMLAAGFTNIFSLCKTFRDYESFGGTHNPEFTMIEWYRAHANFYSIMDDVEKLTKHITRSLEDVGYTSPNKQSLESWERLHMNDAWERYAGVPLNEYLEHSAMHTLCVKKGYNAQESESYEDLFYRIFLNEIEPHLGKKNPVILHHYPAPMAALSRLSPHDQRYAERFEVYAGGFEIANCFSELTDPDEQIKRLQKDREDRGKLRKDLFDIDTEFIDALRTMPPSAGIALGIDRLVQIYAGTENIDTVLSVPMSILFDT